MKYCNRINNAGTIVLPVRANTFVIRKWIMLLIYLYLSVYKVSHEYDRGVIKIFNPLFIINSTWKFKYVFM